LELGERVAAAVRGEEAAEPWFDCERFWDEAGVSVHRAELCPEGVLVRDFVRYFTGLAESGVELEVRVRVATRRDQRVARVVVYLGDALTVVDVFGGRDPNRGDVRGFDFHDLATGSLASKVAAELWSRTTPEVDASAFFNAIRGEDLELAAREYEALPPRLQQTVAVARAYTFGVLQETSVDAYRQGLREYLELVPSDADRAILRLELDPDEPAEATLASLAPAVADYPEEPWLRGIRAVLLLSCGRIDEGRADLAIARREPTLYFTRLGTLFDAFLRDDAPAAARVLRDLLRTRGDEPHVAEMVELFEDTDAYRRAQDLIAIETAAGL